MSGKDRFGREIVYENSFDDRRHFSWEYQLRPSADVRAAIDWCRSNIPPRHNGIIVSARLWSKIEGACTVIGHCWVSIFEHDTDELLNCFTEKSLQQYQAYHPNKPKRNASFAFYNLEDSLMFDLRWR